MADTNVHHMTALRCAQAAGRGTRARTIRARDHRVTVTARALVSSQNDSSRTDNCALLVTLYWSLRSPKMHFRVLILDFI